MKFFKKVLSATLAATMLFSSMAFNSSTVSAAPSISAGWNESLYAEWADSNPDSDAVQVGYKLSSATDYTYLTGNDHQFLIRPASTSGYGRVDIPGLTPGRYDIKITASDGTVHERNGIKVYEYDRSGYAHFNYTEGIGGYKDDGTLKDNAIVVYVTDENKDTVEVPGYEGHAPIAYHSNSSGADWTRTCEGIGNILNNNMKFIEEVTITDNHPLVIRFIGKVNVPKNLTPHGAKDVALGGSTSDNGNLAITKYGRNITLEGIGADATIEGWGFTFSQTSTCPVESGKSFEVRNLTFEKYPEDGLGFQGDDGATCPIERVWVHNNVFYPGYCANPTESDKGEGDGSCDFKRGQYYTMSYNHYIDCHKTNLLGSGTSDDQFYMSLHHNWYTNVMSRQPLAANGNMHIYSTYFENGTSTTVDLRGKNCALLEENVYENCKSVHKSRNATCIAKSYNEVINGGTAKLELKGKRTVVSSLDEAVLTGSSYSFPDGTSIDNFDLNSKYFYKGNYMVTPAAEVPEFVKTYAGTLKAFPETESAEIVINVVTGTTPITDATLTASGLTFKNLGNGKYSATASVGAEYKVTVSKEGYSNQVINVPAQNDGETFTATANLPVDTDGYAVVKLVGGSENTPVTGATVKLADGTVLADQNDGTYKSANQIAVGSYEVTITNTGDCIAPTTAQAIVVKTTDAATEIHLDKVKGAVSVTLKASADSTKTLDASTALVYAGNTPLTYAGDNTFTGDVDINVPLTIAVAAAGWKMISAEPAQVTATKDGVATSVVTLQQGGDLYTWNYTTGENTDNFYNLGTLADWSSAKNNPQTYNGETLTKAVKVNSSLRISFEAPADGNLVLVMDGTGSVYINDVSYDITTGVNTIPVKAGSNTLRKNKTETHLYLLEYEMTGGAVNPPVPPIPTTEGTTEATTSTESTTEVSTNATPVDLGEATNNNGAETGISVTYNEANDTWTLTDTSTAIAAELTIPLVAPITSGKVVVKGTATPSTASGKWAFLRVNGSRVDATTGDVIVAEIASLATDASKNLTLRTDGATYATSTSAITANKAYDYEFVIDLDTKEVTLNVDGKVYTGTTTATSIDSVGAITSNSAARNVTVTTPYVAKITEEEPVPPTPTELTDEIMWDVTMDYTDAVNGLSAGETMFANEEESGPKAFNDGELIYYLANWLQGKTDPKDVNGRNPMAAETTDPATGVVTPAGTGVPATGSFLKFEPTADGVFTMAVKTNGGKITYVTDETGAVVTSIDAADATRYDVVRLNVTAGKSYNIFAGGSKACFYYLGYTPGKEVTTETTTEATTSDNSETTTEASTETTTQNIAPTPTPSEGNKWEAAKDPALAEDGKPVIYTGNAPVFYGKDFDLTAGAGGLTSGDVTITNEDFTTSVVGKFVKDTSTDAAGREIIDCSAFDSSDPKFASAKIRVALTAKAKTDGTIKVNLKANSGKQMAAFDADTKQCLYFLNATETLDPLTIELPIKAGQSISFGAIGSSPWFYSAELVTGSEPPTPAVVWGDVTDDGKVAADDVAMLVQYLLDGTAMTNADVADVNQDGVIDSEDAAMILQNALDSSYTLPR